VFKHAAVFGVSVLYNCIYFYLNSSEAIEIKRLTHLYLNHKNYNSEGNSRTPDNPQPTAGLKAVIQTIRQLKPYTKFSKPPPILAIEQLPCAVRVLEANFTVIKFGKALLSRVSHSRK
jgi:hypothetical protein